MSGAPRAAAGRLLRTRLAVIALMACGLLLLAASPPPPLAVWEDQGRVGGRPISQLWAAGRPEHAWFTDARCRPLVTRFTRDHCLPLVYLASFPRSGNTWTRYLLEASTGLFTSGTDSPTFRQYKDNLFEMRAISDERIWNRTKSKSQMVKFGHLAEYVPWTQGVTIVSKTHRKPQLWTEEETENMLRTSKPLVPFPKNTTRRAVLIVRDPFKSFISLKKFGSTKSVLNDEDMSKLFQGEKWEKFVRAYARIWYKFNASWIKYTSELHVIAYERLTQDPMAELTSLLHFLNVDPDQRRLDCVRSHLEGKAHNRRHGVVPDGETYPPGERTELWSHIHQLNWLLKDRGFPALPLGSYSFAYEFGGAGVRE